MDTCVADGERVVERLIVVRPVRARDVEERLKRVVDGVQGVAMPRLDVTAAVVRCSVGREVMIQQLTLATEASVSCACVKKRTKKDINVVL